jgi:hypothetical protein
MLNNKGSILLWVIFLVIIGYIFLNKREEQKQLTDNSKITTVFIIGKSKVAKGEEYIDYTYLVDSIKYKGSVSIKFCLECAGDCCATGAHVKVKYAVGNPSNSDLVH